MMVYQCARYACFFVRREYAWFYQYAKYACFFVRREYGCFYRRQIRLFLLVLWRLVRCLSRLVRSTRSLCDAGAETNQAMTDGRAPLFIASQKGHLEVVRCLCDAGSAPLRYI